uniref:Uncharacterized protein n=1 Tax=uncultured prokaryote TaxID=198431 RepID=A0A0H5Q4T4_9ZZZZ|nr:hypothetical protein [uncultured prokaryote]
MASGDIYEVTDVQTWGGQQFLNVYFYEQRTAFAPIGITTAQALADEWSDTVLPAILPTQGSDLLHVQTVVRNLFDDTDAGISITGLAGTDAAAEGGSMPAFNAWGLTLNTDNAGIRPGSKRIGGLIEEAQQGGVPTASAITALNAAADAIGAPIEGGLIISDDVMFPVVVKRVREGTEGNYTYRLPETSGEAVVGTIIEVLVRLLVTSQVTRKIGVGV